MAKNTKGGLGRGIGSLMGKPEDDMFVQERTSNRDTMVYNEREDIVYEKNAIKPNNNEVKANNEDVSRETSEKSSESKSNNVRIVGLTSTGSFRPINTKASDEEKSESNLPAEDKGSIEKKDTKKFSRDAFDVSEAVLIQEVSINDVEPNPDQPRTSFKEEDLKELADSIKKEGLIQPILVRKVDGKYQIIAGERRWQASKRAGLEKITVQIKDVDDEKALELALIENIQRSDLNPIEEAYAYKRLMEKNQMTQADIAQAVSKGRSTIANALRLLELPEEAQKLLFDEEISAGHARAILSVPTKEGRLKLTEKLIDNKMSVREVENLARLMSNKPSKNTKREPAPSVYKSVARSLKSSLGTDVKVKSSGGKNRIEITFTDESDLERIFDLISPE